MPELPRLDFGLINDKIGRLLVATGNRLEREWPADRPQHGGAQATVVGLFLGARNTYATSRYVLADTPPNPARKIEYSVAVAPLVRSLVETLATIIFLFDDLVARPVEFFKGGWRSAYLELERVRLARGADPSWTGTITRFDAELERMKRRFELTPAELRDPERAIPSWPQLHGLGQRLNGERRSYVEYLEAWFYRKLSLETHPTWLGIGHLMALLGSETDEEKKLYELEMMRSKHATASLALMLAILTEIEREFRFGELGELKYIWSVLISWDPDVQDYYRHVYERKIGPASIGIVNSR